MKKKTDPKPKPVKLATSPSLSPESKQETVAQIQGPQIARGPRLVNEPEIYEDEPPLADPSAQAADRAKAYAARYQFAGTALQPFSISRERLLLDIRGASGAGDFGRMDVLFGDALRFVWLCLQTGEDLERFQAGIGLPGLPSWPLNRRFQMAIDRWTEANADAVRKHRAELVDTFLDAWRDSQITHAIPESAALSDDEDGSGN